MQPFRGLAVFVVAQDSWTLVCAIRCEVDLDLLQSQKYFYRQYLYPQLYLGIIKGVLGLCVGASLVASLRSTA